jgi:hypothetical protein
MIRTAISAAVTVFGELAAIAAVVGFIAMIGVWAMLIDQPTHFPF